MTHLHPYLPCKPGLTIHQPRLPLFTTSCSVLSYSAYHNLLVIYPRQHPNLGFSYLSSPAFVVCCLSCSRLPPWQAEGCAPHLIAFQAVGRRRQTKSGHGLLIRNQSFLAAPPMHMPSFREGAGNREAPLHRILSRAQKEE